MMMMLIRRHNSRSSSLSFLSSASASSSSLFQSSSRPQQPQRSTTSRHDLLRRQYHQLASSSSSVVFPAASGFFGTAIQNHQNQKKMSFHFASSEYANCFNDLPIPDVPKLRESAIKYVDTFNEKDWYDNPIVSLVNGKKLDDGGQIVDTVNALGVVNGKQVYATPSEVQQIKAHITTYEPPSKDLREPLRKIELELLDKYAGLLIGNQCIDFQKQDGITEIEESIMANHVERNLNDLLLRDEASGKIEVNRQPIYISCVSNFTNFLDLFRKTIRSMEVGIPCVVLGRSNTVQHSYRWTELLMDLCIKQGVDPGMITYLSCPLDDIKDITQSCQSSTGNLYSTCSRELAAAIKSGYPNTVTSTGGPNTLIAMDWTPALEEATRISATIESSGQCTALRHVITPPNVTESDITNMLSGISSAESASEAMKQSKFDCIFTNHKGSATPPTTTGSDKEESGDTTGSYHRHETVDASYRMSNTLPPNNIEEYWRKVVIDVSTLDDITSHLNDIAGWLNTNQPISLAVNGKTKQQSLDFGLALWEHTGMVVNTIGTPEAPALTCQARPQEAEVFGEFPPRHLLTKYTKYPVIVPSSTPSYDTCYSNTYLLEQSKKSATGKVDDFLSDITDDKVRGYCITLLEYLQDSLKENPKRGFGTSRTAMWGLQRPPLLTTTYLHSSTNNFDDLAPHLMLFLATNAKDAVAVSTSEDNELIKSLCGKHNIAVTIKPIQEKQLLPGDNLVHVDSSNTTAYPMVGQFVSTLFPLGHIKSTLPNDEEFISRVQGLQKWLKLVE